MKKLVLLLFMLPMLAVAETAQDTTYWKYNGSASLNFSQVSLTNWAAGGKSSVAGVFLLNANANYKKDKWIWDNALNIGYGLLNEEGGETTKSEDKLDISSKVGYEAVKSWYYSALMGFNTQFSNGYNYPNTENAISRFMAPAYLNLALGMDYKPSEKFSAFISPLNAKTTFVLDETLSDAGNFGVTPGDKMRAELGAMAKASLNINLMENVKLATDLTLFSNYLENPENIDITWNMLISMKVNKWLSANLATNLIYDDDIEIEKDGKLAPRIQFKQLFGAGLSVNF